MTPPERTWARIPGMVPIAVSCVVNAPTVAELPEVGGAKYALPFTVREMLTALGAVWMRVKGDPVGVQIDPTAELEQAASVPTPGATLSRSK